MLKFNSFINEGDNNDQDNYFIRVNNPEDALSLSKYLQLNGFIWHPDFNDELIPAYYDFYNLRNTNHKSLAFRIFMNDPKEFYIRINVNFHWDNEKTMGNLFDFPNDIDELKELQIIKAPSPNMQPKTFVYESRNSETKALEIAVKITSKEEYDILIDMLENIDTEHLDCINGNDNYNWFEDRGDHYFFFCVDEKNKHLVPGLVTTNHSITNAESIDRLNNNMESYGDWDGVYKEIFTINDIDIVKKILTNKKIYPKRSIPNLKPKKFIYEDNKFDNIDSFNNFMICENIDDSVPFIITQRLEDLLKKVKHPISKKLIELSDDLHGYSDKATLIDLNEEDDEQFIYTVPNKYEDAIKKHHKDINTSLPKSDIYDFIKTNNDIYRSYTSGIRIGRLINKLFPDQYPPSGSDNSIESFVDGVITKRKEKFKHIDIVSGKDIIKYYNEDSYYEEAFNGSELGNSCMRYGHCGDSIKFYAENPDVQLVILRTGKDGEKISARALLWKIQYKIGNIEHTGYFMDRIYFTKRYQKNLLTQYAYKKRWYYKKTQNSESNTLIYDPTMNMSSSIPLLTVSTFKKSSTGQYPYMDTLKWFYVDRGFLASTLKFKKGGEKIYFLEDVDGSYVEESQTGIYVPFYDDYIEEKDLVYCKYGDDMRLIDDAFYLEKYDAYATDNYAKRNCIFDNDGRCVLKQDAIKYYNKQGETKYTSKEYAKDHYYLSPVSNNYFEDEATYKLLTIK